MSPGRSWFPGTGWQARQGRQKSRCRRRAVTHRSLSITSFVGFLPAADPQIVILVKLVEPKTSRWAEKVALPVFGAVARDAVWVLKIRPDDRMP